MADAGVYLLASTYPNCLIWVLLNGCQTLAAAVIEDDSCLNNSKRNITMEKF